MLPQAAPRSIQQAPWGRFRTLDDPDGNGLIIQQDNPQFRES